MTLAPGGAYGGKHISPGDVAVDGFPIDAQLSDGTNLTQEARGIWVGVAGNVKITSRGGNALTFKGCAAGTVIPWIAVRVWSTGTTATDLVGGV